MKPFRNAHWRGEIAATETRVYTRHYDTQEQAAADAARLAADGEHVHLERWDPATQTDPINRGWGLYDHREPHDPTAYEMPLPGAAFDGGTVIASIIMNDDAETSLSWSALLLMPQPGMFYRYIEAHDSTVVLRQQFENINPAVAHYADSTGGY